MLSGGLRRFDNESLAAHDVAVGVALNKVDRVRLDPYRYGMEAEVHRNLVKLFGTERYVFEFIVV